MEIELSIRNLTKSYQDLEIFRNFSISFCKGKINCLLGPSGCGKTTLLNIISGSIKPDHLIENELEGHVFSYVFQEPRLLPWKTVLDNLIFTLKGHIDDKDLNRVAMDYLKLVEIDRFSPYFPSALSGGMKQRLSLARAFSFPSDIILMDEPFKALDVKLKSNLMDRFYNLWEKDKRTVIFVTHEVEEAIQLGQRIIVLSTPPVRIISEFNKQENNDALRKEILSILNTDE